MKYISLLLVSTLLLGCSSNKKQGVISSQLGIPVINLFESISTVSSLSLSEAIEKLDIVPLEMTDQSMLIRHF